MNDKLELVKSKKIELKKKVTDEESRNDELEEALK